MFKNGKVYVILPAHVVDFTGRVPVAYLSLCALSLVQFLDMKHAICLQIACERHVALVDHETREPLTLETKGLQYIVTVVHLCKP